MKPILIAAVYPFAGKRQLLILFFVPAFHPAVPAAVVRLRSRVCPQLNTPRFSTTASKMNKIARNFVDFTSAPSMERPLFCPQ